MCCAGLGGGGHVVDGWRGGHDPGMCVQQWHILCLHTEGEENAEQLLCIRACVWMWIPHSTEMWAAALGLSGNLHSEAR